MTVFSRLSPICMAMAMTAGCAGMDYAMDNYSKVKVERFTASTGTLYRIFDKPDENRLMITPSLGASAGQGFVQGLTSVSAVPPEVLFEDAAIEFLASKGRTCKATKTFMIVQPQFEVRYDCAAPVATDSPPVPTAAPKQSG